MMNWLDGIEKINDWHIGAIMSVIMLYVPFTVAVLVFDPGLIGTLNPFMYLLIGLVFGFIVLMPTLLVVLEMQYTDKKSEEYQGQWSIYILFIVTCLLGLLWTVVSGLYYISSQTHSLVQYLVSMLLIFYIACPLIAAGISLKIKLTKDKENK